MDPKRKPRTFARDDGSVPSEGCSINMPAGDATAGPGVSDESVTRPGDGYLNRGAHGGNTGPAEIGLASTSAGQTVSGESSQLGFWTAKKQLRSEIEKAQMRKRKPEADESRRGALIGQSAESEETPPKKPRLHKSPKAEVGGDSTGVTNEPKNTKVRPFRDTLACFKLAIVADEHPVQMIRAEIVEDIRDLIWRRAVESPEPKPDTILGNLASGAFHVTCMGETSVIWLQSLGGQIVGGLKLRVVEAKDLPRPVKMAWKRRPTKSAKIPEELSMLQCMNKGLDTTEWRVVGHALDGGFARSIILMDRASAEYIRQRDYSLRTGIDQSHFKLLDDASGKGIAPVCPSSTSVQTAISNAPALEGEASSTGEPVPVSDDAVSSPVSMGTGNLILVSDELGLVYSPEELEEDDSLLA